MLPYALLQKYYNFYDYNDIEQILVNDSRLLASWIGTKEEHKYIPILILVGHADSQGLTVAGSPGEAVDKFGLKPMHPEISDELFWDLKLQESSVQLGNSKGLNNRFFYLGIRDIVYDNDTRTNLSVGKEFAKNGWYEDMPLRFILMNKVNIELAQVWSHHSLYS